MARAKRHYIPGQVWHLTHRCHKREFLLKFHKDRQNWVHWLYEAKKRYGLVIFNYTVTSNHIHLLVLDAGDRNVIPQSMQLIAGRTGQEYNQRKNRKGAFWEDRYHATAVEAGEHLCCCLVYLDLNMVRAGVVSHPAEWAYGGYNEIQQPRQRKALINYDELCSHLGIAKYEQLKVAHREWVAEGVLKVKGNAREEMWTQSIAVGSSNFIEKTKEALGIRAKGRKLKKSGDACELREPQFFYHDDFEGKKQGLSAENSYFGRDYDEISGGGSLARPQLADLRKN
ncbi:MAG: transposase [Desulfobulbaceae bacterium]|nr:transposase [Desulfobulbaceae bacterium]